MHYTLGTWITNIADQLIYPDEFEDALSELLYSDSYARQDYVFTYFRQYICKPNLSEDMYRLSAIEEGLTKGDERFYNLVKFYFRDNQSSIPLAIKPLFDNFKPRIVVEDNDLPF